MQVAMVVHHISEDVPSKIRNQFQHITRFIAASESTRQSWIDWGVNSSKVVTVYNGIPINRFSRLDREQRDQLRVEMGLDPAKRLIVYCGPVATAKGVLDLQQAVSSLSSRMPDLQCVIAGDSGPPSRNMEQFDQISAGLERTGRFLLVGHQENVVPYYQIADVTVLPSHREAFGRSLVESLACGVPCVATAVGGMKEILSGELETLLAPPNSPEELAKTVERALDTPIDPSLLMERARNHDIERTADGVLDQYRSLIS